MPPRVGAPPGVPVTTAVCSRVAPSAARTFTRQVVVLRAVHGGRRAPGPQLGVRPGTPGVVPVNPHVAAAAVDDERRRRGSAEPGHQQHADRPRCARRGDLVPLKYAARICSAVCPPRARPRAPYWLRPDAVAVALAVEAARSSPAWSLPWATRVWATGLPWGMEPGWRSGRPTERRRARRTATRMAIPMAPLTGRCSRRGSWTRRRTPRTRGRRPGPARRARRGQPWRAGRRSASGWADPDRASGEHLRRYACSRVWRCGGAPAMARRGHAGPDSRTSMPRRAVPFPACCASISVTVRPAAPPRWRRGSTACRRVVIEAHALTLPRRKAEDAVAAFEDQVPDEPGIVVGGHSFGGRVASLSAAGAGRRGDRPLRRYAGLVCLSYPLHRPGSPETAADRTAHWPQITCPGAPAVGDARPVRSHRPARGGDAHPARRPAGDLPQARSRAAARPRRCARP